MRSSSDQLHWPSFSLHSDSLSPMLDDSKKAAIMSHIGISSTSVSSGVPAPIPLGFAGQIKALEHRQQELSDLVKELQQDRREKKEMVIELLARVEALEQANETLDARRREAVSQLMNLRTRHQEAANAFQLRVNDVQPEDLEGMLVAWGTTINTVMNHQQQVLRYVRPANVQPAYGQAVAGPSQQGAQAAYVPVYYAYPPHYTQYGYCLKHNVPYPCTACGN